MDDGLSRNGTFLNGRRLSHRVRLRDRDKIRVGETVLTFCAPPQTATQQTVVGGALPTLPRPTDRRRRVLVALCRPYRDAPGYATAASNQPIAMELFLSLNAVQTHLRVLHKFGIDASRRTRNAHDSSNSPSSSGWPTTPNPDGSPTVFGREPPAPQAAAAERLLRRAPQDASPIHDLRIAS